MPERAKPYPDFPLRWHQQGYWCKKIRGRLHYFGPRYGDWQTALAEYQRDAADLHAGREPQPQGLTVAELADLYLQHKDAQRQAGEFAERSFRDYLRVGQMLADYFGDRTVSEITPQEFGRLRSSLAAGVSVITTANRVRIARMIFRWAETEELIPGRVSFGSQFSEPSARSKKQHRAERQRSDGLKMFTPLEVRRVLFAASPVWRAMVLLGINCGYGNSDISRLLISQVGPVIDYPRPKTGEARRCVLWPETLSAVMQAIELRPVARSKDLRGRVFLTRSGREWVRDSNYVDDEIAKQFGKLLRSIGIKRPGLSFYALRHTVVTIGEELADKPALSMVLGHSDNSTAAHYRERIDDERLRKIADHLLQWLAK